MSCSPYPIKAIANQSLRDGWLHPDWKVANVVPVYKSGDKSNPGNYRQVSIVSTFSKILELLVKNKMMLHLSSMQLINPSQHGFLRSRSVVSNLIDCFHDWLGNLDIKILTDVIYIDFSKDFDSIIHSKLLHKLEFLFKFNPSIITWLKS